MYLLGTLGHVDFLKLQLEPKLLKCKVNWAGLLLSNFHNAWWDASPRVPRIPSDSADRPQQPLTIPAVHWHLAQHSQANKDIVDKSKTVLHDVNHGIGEDTDIEALEESS